MIKQVDKDNGFISLAVKRINPNAEFVIRENNLDMITWGKDTTPISKSDIEAKMVEVQTTYDNNEYQRVRKFAYPDLREQLDLLYKDMAADKGDKTGEWFKAVKKVKDDNPKE